MSLFGLCRVPGTPNDFMIQCHSTNTQPRCGNHRISLLWYRSAVSNMVTESSEWPAGHYFDDVRNDFVEEKNTKNKTVYVWRNYGARSCNHCCSGKAISVTQSEWAFVALGNQHAMRKRHIVICCPVPLYNIFPHYLINGTIFGKKSLNTKCVFWFSVQLLSETFLILRRTERDMIKIIYRSACECVPPCTGTEVT